jgi:hypothetical protein
MGWHEMPVVPQVCPALLSKYRSSNLVPGMDELLNHTVGVWTALP